MNLKYKILAVLAVLAAGIALTACGGSGAPASAPASIVVPASSHVAEEGVTEPINLRTWTLDDLDDTQTTTFVSASITSGVQNGKLTAKVFGYDIYKKEEIEKLAVGNKIAFHEEGAAQDQCVTTEVKSIERNDQHHFVSINGGIEAGGVELTLDHDVYRTVTFDDYPVYYEMGEVTLPLAGGVTLSDSSADPQASAVETDGADAVAEAVNAEPDGWMPNNTLVFTEDGTISSIVRIWVP